MRDVLGVAGEVLEAPDAMAVGLVGCGSHSYRNVLPAMKFVPGLDLVATADLDERKAALYARQFGAGAHYTDHRRMLREEDLDGVLLSVGLDAAGRPQYPDIAPDVLDAGVSVWMEKPPAASVAGVERIADHVTAGTFAMVGFKMMFTPAVEKMADLVAAEEFGDVQSYEIAYALDLPSQPRKLHRPAARRFLDDVTHPLSEIVHLFGEPESATTYRSGEGDGFAVLEHPEGFTGTLHLMGGAGRTGPAIDLKVVGEGPIARMNGGTEVEYHQDGSWGSYARDPSFLRDGDAHTARYSPQLREPLGALALHSEALFGYVGELRAFASALRSGSPDRADVEDALSVMRVYETLCRTPGRTHPVAERPEPDDRSGWIVNRRLFCPNCGGRMRPKNGWSSVCPPGSGGCGNTVPMTDDGQTLTDAEAAVVEEVVSTHLPAVERPYVEFWRSDRLLVEDERTYVLVGESEDADGGYFAKLFVKYNDDDSHAHEYDVLSSMDLDPLETPTVHACGDSWYLMDYYDGELLADLLADGPVPVETIGDVVADLATWHDRRTDDRHTVAAGGRSRQLHYGDVHGDFDPWNVIVCEDREVVVDWENFRSGVQEFDVLHFVALAAVAVFENGSPDEQVDRMERGEEPFGRIRSAAFDAYASRRDVSVETLDSLWGAYADYRLERLRTEVVPRVVGPDGGEEAIPDTIYAELASRDWGGEGRP